MKFLLPFFLFFSFSLRAQKIEYPSEFIHLLDSVGVDFYEPLEAGYRDYEPLENRWQPCHFAMRSHKEKMEIRYYIEPWNNDQTMASLPNINTFRTLTMVASTDDETARISGIQPTKKSLLDEFNADWGMTYFFKPKIDFSEKPHCRMMALCKEGQGTLFVFFLFDDVNNEALDVRKYALKFKSMNNEQ